MLRRLTTPLARVEIVVIAFARTIDWHFLKYIQHELTVSEFKELRHRIGVVNMWDESGQISLSLSLYLSFSSPLPDPAFPSLLLLVSLSLGAATLHWPCQCV